MAPNRMERITRTAFVLMDAYRNPVIVARNCMDESRTQRGRMFWLLVGQCVNDFKRASLVGNYHA